MAIAIDARGAIWYRGTGIGTYTFQLVYHLKQRPDADRYRLLWPGEEYVGLDINDTDEFQRIQSSIAYWEEHYLPRQLSRERVELYHVPQNGIGLPYQKVCAQVVTIHDLIPYIYPETVGKGYLKTFIAEMPRIMEQTDRIIAVSKCSKKDIEHIFGFPANRIDVIYEAPEPIYRPLDKNQCKKILTAEYGITDDFVLYVGGFSPRKNVKGLLNAFAEILADLKKPILMVLPGKKQKEFDQLDAMVGVLKLSDYVIFPGFVPVEHLPYFYNAASVFVYPSFYEGFGLPPLEAMACGTPVITANTSSLPEVVGQSALMFNSYDSTDLAAKLFKVLTNPDLASSLGQKGLNRAKKFSWAKVAKATAEVYQRVLG